MSTTVHEAEFFEVVLLSEEERTDPSYNYGVVNKEFGVYDALCTSETAAVMLCNQYDWDKRARREDKATEEFQNNILSIVSQREESDDDKPTT